ncbi:glucosaminidase domain-containing protein [Ferviditalea candida]|uniref:Glucosaminidase domain-containing protein n=1 Tax=Ferviditalea candida TaxID=3108399 RepID=A0ABU5ZLN7_9BACL|nr:glucosaminidase domain-containing protein [Paenibacillaceae bacterium T2]
MRKYTLQPDPLDMRDYVYRSTFKTPADLPKQVDLRTQMSPVVDQGSIGSCTANAIVSGLREYLLLQAGKPLEALSRLFLYWHEREILGRVNEDSGASLRDGMKVLQQTGVSSELLWPYSKDFRTQPDADAEADAGRFRIREYHRVNSMDDIKAALAQGLPVVFGFVVYESLERVGSDGMVSVPDVGKEARLGGHAMVFAGYDDDRQVFIVRNSWGPSWGDKGYCYLPYRAFYGFVMDTWTGSVMMRSKFIKSLAPYAVEDMRKSRVPASLTIAQGCLESADGNSGLTQDANNLFGIKGTGPAGSVLKWTTEYVNGVAQRVQAYFRAYHDWGESVADHSALLVNGLSWDPNRYRNVLGVDGRTAAREIQAAGYATDPNYAEKLIAIMDEYNLYQYDMEADEMTAEEKKAFDVLAAQVAKLAEKIPAPQWFVTEFGSTDLGGLIHDPKFTEEGWRTLAVSLRAQEEKGFK